MAADMHRKPQRTRTAFWRALLDNAIRIAGFGAAAACVADESLTKAVRFSDYSAAASSAELARRLFTPLAYQRVRAHLGDTRTQSLDLAEEKFAVYVPPGPAPERGYGLLVFIPPWPEASLPRDWPRVLDRHGLIFVSAANSGNDAGTLDRRVPLALLGYENIRKRYPVDAERVYVGGLSGGSRVALRVALAYPDLFRGALLNAGSDPIGDGDVALPPADLFRRFQESTRLVFLTGARDEINVHNDLVSEKSLRSWCVFDLHSTTMQRRGHEIADAAGLEQALKELEKPRTTDSDKLAACRSGIDSELAAKKTEAETALEHGERARAAAVMKEIDERYGGVAADIVAELATRLDRAD